LKELSRNSPANRIELFFGLGAELISLLFLTRLVADTSIRMFTPFLPDISAGLGLTITSFSWVLTVRSLMGLLSPLIGVAADRYGRRLVLISAQGVRAVGMVWLAYSSGWGSLPSMLLLSLASSSYYPVLRAYVSDLSLPERRGRALAIVDAAFPTAGIVGLPLVGWMIEGWGWNFPILALGALNLISAVILAFSLPPTIRETSTAGIFNPMVDLMKEAKVWVSILVSTLELMIFTLFFLFWALLLSEKFLFSPIQIGLTGTIIGIAELLGLLIAGLVVDQIGKRFGTLLGFILCFFLLPGILFVGTNLFLIRVLLVLFMIAFEFGITSSIPLIAEQTVENRATLFCLVSFGNAVGAGISPPLVTYLWSLGGSTMVVLTGSILTLIVVVLVWRYLFDDDAPEGEIDRIPPEIHTL
jgi:predicted MFS family arabinose efflux permease